MTSPHEHIDLSILTLEELREAKRETERLPYNADTAEGIDARLIEINERIGRIESINPKGTV